MLIQFVVNFINCLFLSLSGKYLFIYEWLTSETVRCCHNKSLSSVSEYINDIPFFFTVKELIRECSVTYERIFDALFNEWSHMMSQINLKFTLKLTSNLHFKFRWRGIHCPSSDNRGGHDDIILLTMTVYLKVSCRIYSESSNSVK